MNSEWNAWKGKLKDLRNYLWIMSIAIAVPMAENLISSAKWLESDIDSRKNSPIDTKQDIASMWGNTTKGLLIVRTIFFSVKEMEFLFLHQA